MFTNLKSLDEYLKLIDANKETVVAVWAQRSFLEGLSDEFSDRDFAIIWDNSIPFADKRLKAAQELNFDIHEIKNVTSIGQSFDMFSDGEFLFNIGHGTKEKEQKWYEALFGEKFPSDLEAILMSISALESGKVYYQKDNWVDKLLKKVKLNAEIKENVIKHYSVKISKDLKLLQKSSSREDLMQFLKYLKKVLRNFQIIYLLRENKPVISEKFFEHRFANIENGKITKLIRKISSQIDMNNVYKEVKSVALGLGVKQSEKFKA